MTELRSHTTSSSTRIGRGLGRDVGIPCALGPLGRSGCVFSEGLREDTALEPPAGVGRALPFLNSR